ncbi:hypothetical protein BZA05DRAFT_443929 [Tricharina praecox]|uniref:uncharacterized protein n=1 Tax=Tricharina praecox TaxID=43433 RepID=UPI00221E70D5|nr:uncharacterized protein BZA05DRAFT_443929 [Tricharina praecox]KAI5854431.1 hypothetical protein BZA05DRAFT_443929 [Tricharina praecox]
MFSRTPSIRAVSVKAPSVKSQNGKAPSVKSQNGKASSVRSKHSKYDHDGEEDHSSERTPLLSYDAPTPATLSALLTNIESRQDPSEHSPLLTTLEPRSYRSTPSHSQPQTPQHKARRRRNWSVVALAALCGLILAILSLGFFVPAAAERYAQDAVALDIDSVGVDSFTDKGVKVAVQAKVNVDARRVKGWGVRTLGRIGTFVVGHVSVKEFDVRVHLPDYDNALVGTARVPGMTIDIRNGHTTNLYFVTDTQPGSVDTIRLLANDYLSGNLNSVKVLGEVDLRIRKWFVSVNPGRMIRELILTDLPELPTYELTRLHVQEVEIDNKRAILANVSVVIENPYPFAFDVSPLGFEVSLPGCKSDSHIKTASATSSQISIKPKTDIVVDVAGLIRSLPAGLTAVCPNNNLSPMDQFLGNYLHGQEAVVYVGGDGVNYGGRAPAWLVELLRSVTVPIPVPGNTFDNVVQSFGLSHVSIKLPGESGNVAPLLSATVEAVIALPKEMTLPINITQLRALADVSYEQHAFGTLNIKEWIPATSERIPGKDNLLRVSGVVTDAPLDVTDYDTFGEVVRKILFGGGKAINLGINGTADADINTSLGEFIVRKLPASGNITLDGLPDFTALPFPTLNDIVIESTTEDSMNLKISVSAENPMPWEAFIPYSNIVMSHDGFIIGNGTIKNMHVVPGKNSIVVSASWDPKRYGGERGVKAGEELLGNYISGHNATLTLSTHEGSFPHLPELGKALSSLKITIPMPRIGQSDPSEPSKHFIESATMHIFSSTADFYIRNPLPYNGIVMHVLNGSALYNGSTLGTIDYRNRFLINPGNRGGTMSPRLPVEWSLDSVGYEAMKKALGGQLKIHAQAMTKISIGNMVMEVFYNASDPVEAHIRL